MRPADPRALVAIAAGGFAGTVARVALAEEVTRGPQDWPWATFGVNVLGALVIGVVVGVITRRPPRTDGGELWRLGLTTGLCGALTTFSALQLELLDMLSHGALGLAAAYVAASLAAGAAAVWVGLRVGRAAVAARPGEEHA